MCQKDIDALTKNTKIGVFPKKLNKPDEFAQKWQAIEENIYLNGEKIKLDGAFRWYNIPQFLLAQDSLL